MYFQPIGKNKSPNRCEHRKTDLKPPSNFPQDSPQQKSPHKKTFQHKNHTKNNKKHPKKSSQKIQAKLFFGFIRSITTFPGKKNHPSQWRKVLRARRAVRRRTKSRPYVNSALSKGRSLRTGEGGGIPVKIWEYNLGTKTGKNGRTVWVIKHEKTHMVYM